MDLFKLKLPWNLQFLSLDDLDENDLKEILDILSVKNSSVQLPWDSVCPVEDEICVEDVSQDGETCPSSNLPEDPTILSLQSPANPTPSLVVQQLSPYEHQFSLLVPPLGVLQHGNADPSILPHVNGKDAQSPPPATVHVQAVENVSTLKDELLETSVKYRVCNKHYPRRNKKKVPKTDYYDTPEEETQQNDHYKQSSGVLDNNVYVSCVATQDHISAPVTSMPSPLVSLPVGTSYPPGIPTVIYLPIYPTYSGYISQVPTPPPPSLCEGRSAVEQICENSNKDQIVNQTDIAESVHSFQDSESFSSSACNTSCSSFSENRGSNEQQILDDAVYINKQLSDSVNGHITNCVENIPETGILSDSNVEVSCSGQVCDAVELSSDGHTVGATLDSFRTSSEWCNISPTTETCDQSSPIPTAAHSVAHRSWADLFKNTPASSSTTAEQSVSVPTVSLAVNTALRTGTEQDGVQDSTTKDDEVSSVVTPEEDELTPKLGKLFQEIKVNHIPISQQPRGLINRRNWCYINAILQALLACPPFYNLMRQLPLGPNVKRGKSSTPILDSLAKFSSEFPPVPVNKNKKKEELTTGTPFEPVYIYKMLSAIKSDCVKGQQEDAEEFLSCILNGLHDEIVALIKAVQKNNSHSIGNGEVAANGHLEESGDEDAWHVMGPKNRSMLTRLTNIFDSPISTIFGGQIKNVLTTGSGTSASIQPFFTLQLDIQSEKVDSVLEALSQMTAKEPLQGYTCCKTKQEVEAFSRICLEKLPPVLILHFKRFVYKKDGGCKKVMKKTDYPIKLELGKDLLSPELRKNKPQVYTLFAVVYHHGEEAMKGHYIADIFHLGSDSWLRCDDRNITQISEGQVLQYNPPCVPYLLFYRSSDIAEQSA